MTNSDRNTRTLIVCFVIGIFALLPLRFAELNQNDYLESQEAVLGVTTKEEVVLPNAAFCFLEDDARNKIEKIDELLNKEGLTMGEQQDLTNQIKEINNNRCQ